MRRDQFLWLIVIYFLLFIVGYWPEFFGKGKISSHSPVYSIPVTVQISPVRDS